MPGTVHGLIRSIAAIATAAACHAQTAPVVPPSGSFIIVANQRIGAATIVELSSGRVSNLSLGANPHELAVSPDSRVAAFTIPSGGVLGGGNKVVVVELATMKVQRVVDIGGYRAPHGIAFVSDSVALIGTLEGTSAVYVDVRNGRVVRAVDGLPANPYIVELTKTGRAYVSSPHGSAVSEIDVANARLLRTITDIPDDPSGIGVSADGKELYAAIWRQNTGGGVAIYDLQKGAMATKLPATQPRRIAVTADQRLVVVSDRDHVRIIDRATRQMNSVPIGANGWGSGVACSPDSTRCYVSLSQAAEVVEIDVTAGRVLRRFPAQPGLDGVAYVAR